MKKQHLFPLFVMVVLLAVGSLHAQTGEVKAAIAFDFTAGRMSLPAGEYSITAMSDAGRILCVSGRVSKGFITSHPVEKMRHQRRPSWCSAGTATGISSIKSGWGVTIAGASSR